MQSKVASLLTDKRKRISRVIACVLVHRRWWRTRYSFGTKINRNLIKEKKTISDKKNLFRELITLNVWQKPFQKVHPFWRIATYFEEKKIFWDKINLFEEKKTFLNIRNILEETKSYMRNGAMILWSFWRYKSWKSEKIWFWSIKCGWLTFWRKIVLEQIPLQESCWRLDSEKYCVSKKTGATVNVNIWDETDTK